MFIKREKYRYSIFIKLLIGLLLVIIPLYLLGLFINISGAKDIKQKILVSTKQQVYNYLDGLEREVERIIKVQREYLNDSNILKLSITAEVISDYEKIQCMLRVMSHMNMIKTLSPYVENVNVHIPLIERTISVNNGLRPLDIEELNALKSHSSLYGLPIVWWNDRLFLNVPFADPKLSYSKGPIFDLSVELSKRMIEKDLNKLISYAGSGVVIVNNQTGHIIGGGNHSILYNVNNLFNRNEIYESKEGQGTIKIENQDFLLVYKYSEYLDSTLLAFIPQRQVLGPLDSYNRLSWALSGLAVIIIFFFAIWIYKMVMQPLDSMVEAFGEVEKGNLNISIHRKNKDEFGYLYEQFNEMVRNIESLFDQMYEQKIRAQNAELKQLQYQINPHFLYNSIFLIYRMAKLEDYDSIIRLTKHLGTYYQFITRNASDIIPFQEEIEHVRNYIEIQSIRFGNRIKVVWQQEVQDYSNIMVPRLILQPFIENAYQHGLGNKLSDGEIHINISGNDQRVSISVEDNGEGMDHEDLVKLQNRISHMNGEIETTAIVNIHRRLKLKYGNSSGVTVSKSEMGGFKAVIDIFLKGDHNVSTVNSG